MEVHANSTDVLDATCWTRRKVHTPPVSPISSPVRTPQKGSEPLIAECELSADSILDDLLPSLPPAFEEAFDEFLVLSGQRHSTSGAVLESEYVSGFKNDAVCDELSMRIAHLLSTNPRVDFWWSSDGAR